MDEKILKTYEKIFFVTIIILILFELMSLFLGIYESVRGIRLIITVAMFIVWVILLRNKELTIFELILLFMSCGYILELSFALILGLGIFAEMIFGVPVFTFLVGLLLVFFVIAILGLFYKTSKTLKNQEKSRIKVYRYDIYIIIVCLIIALVVIGLYLTS